MVQSWVAFPQREGHHDAGQSWRRQANGRRGLRDANGEPTRVLEEVEGSCGVGGYVTAWD